MQVVTVTVRALATHDLSPGSNLLRAVGKEILVAGVNAACFALIMGGIASGLVPRLAPRPRAGRRHDLQHDVGGLAGTLIPLAVNHLGWDPAVSAGPSSRPRPTCFGFFSFLGWRRYSSCRGGWVQRENSNSRVIIYLTKPME